MKGTNYFLEGGEEKSSIPSVLALSWIVVVSMRGNSGLAIAIEGKSSSSSDRARPLHSLTKVLYPLLSTVQSLLPLPPKGKKREQLARVFCPSSGKRRQQSVYTTYGSCCSVCASSLRPSIKITAFFLPFFKAVPAFKGQPKKGEGGARSPKGKGQMLSRERAFRGTISRI